MVKAFFVCGAFVFFSSSCKQGSSGNSGVKRTSDGTELRESYTLGTEEGESQSKSTSTKQVTIGSLTGSSSSGERQPLTAGVAEKCSENQVLYSGYCLDNKAFYIWHGGASNATKITDRSSVDCGTPAACADLGGFEYSGEAFIAVSSGPSDVLDALYAVYSLSSPEGGQYLTSQPQERDHLLQNEEFSGGDILFYLVPGKAMGEDQLLRFQRADSPGVWRYQIDFSDASGYAYDTTVGYVKKGG